MAVLAALLIPIGIGGTASPAPAVAAGPPYARSAKAWLKASAMPCR